MISTAIPETNTTIVFLEQPFHSLSIIPQRFANVTFNAIKIQNDKVISVGDSVRKPLPRLWRAALRRMTLSISFILITTMGLPLLWIFVNWLVSSLTQGKGTFKEIFIMTSYCLIPLVIYNAVFFVASHFLIPGNISYLDI